MTDEPNPKVHIGKRRIVQYVGGDYHGEKKLMRSPIRERIEVAKPPDYLGDGFYNAAIGGINYQVYILQYYKDEAYYVWERWLEEWHKDPEAVFKKEYETTNQRVYRLEEERKEAEREEKEHQKELARKDFEVLGIAIEGPNGRIDPRSIRIFLNVNHPDVEKRFFKREKL